MGATDAARVGEGIEGVTAGGGGVVEEAGSAAAPERGSVQGVPPTT